MLSPFSYVRAESLDQAVKHLLSDRAVIHAGGTDLLPCLRDHVLDAGKVVSLSGLTNLRGMKKSDGGLRIGALTTISEVAQDSLVKERYTALSQEIGRAHV